MKKTTAFITVMATLLLAGTAFAYDITLPGVNVNTDTGTVTQPNGNTIKYQQGADGTNSATITKPGGSTITGTSSPTGNSATITNGSLNITGSTSADGTKDLKVDLNNGSLHVVATQTDALDPASAKVIVSLQNGADKLIKTDEDLTVYGNIVTQSRPAVQGISVTSDGVSVNYTQPGKFLGLIKMGLPAAVKVVANGKVTIQLPWYSFLFSKDTASLTNSITANINGAQVTVSGLSDTNDTVRVQSDAKIINALSASVQGQSVTVTSNGSVNLTGNNRSIIITR